MDCCTEAAFVVIAIAAWVAASRRREALAALAARWGFSWNGGKDPLEIEVRYGAFSAIARGHSRHASNVFTGCRNGRQMVCFDYRYTTGSGKSQSTHCLSGALIGTVYLFPHLLIRPENFLDKVAEFVGMDDIDFESAEFSRKFFVKAEDRKFAFDLFHARAMLIVLLLVLGFPLFVILVLCAIYNGLVKLRNQCREAWPSVIPTSRRTGMLYSL